MEHNKHKSRRTPVWKRWNEIMWQRHRHPASGWTRYILAVLLGMAIWHHAWTAIVVLLLGVLTNPFWFPPPKTNGSFMTRAVDGERIWLARASFREKFMIIAIPSLQIFPMIWALWENEPIWTAFFTVMVLGGKTVFLAWTAEIAGQNNDHPSGPLAGQTRQAETAASRGPLHARSARPSQPSIALPE